MSELHYLPWASPWACGAGILSVAAGMTMLAFMLHAPSYRINVAFVGNSMQFVNDLPRFMQALSGIAHEDGDFNIQQQSCLHGALNFKTLLYKGNGMAHKWNHTNALLPNGLYDLGACTVPQLLLGYDENLEFDYGNDDDDGGNNDDDDADYYKDDGKNPCFIDEDYYNYMTQEVFDGTWQPHYDFVVLNDNTKWPAIEEKLEVSLQVLQESYVPMLQENGAIPVLYATHGYQSDVVDVSDMGNVSTFTSDVFEGYRQYAALLEQNLPSSQRPRIAPVGLAFLLVYEQDYEMWEKLFFVDGLHPSPHGSYLMGCVLYATLYGYMPGNEALPDIPETLWSRARKMQIGGKKYAMPFPTYDECVYLYSIARKVMMYNERPKTWTRYYDESSESDYIGANG